MKITEDSHGWQIWVFFHILIHGKNSKNRPSDFTQNARSKIFVSLQTYLGI